MNESSPENAVQYKANNFEARRNGIRGDDRAVLEIGTEVEKGQLLRILKDPSHHSREELQKILFKIYSGEAYGDHQWRKFTGGWTTPETPTPYGALRKSHPEYSELSLDAGFMTHLPEFVEMIDKGEIKSGDYEWARMELKEKLGYKTMYRGTMLTDEEVASIKETGAISPLALQVIGSDDPKEEFEAKALSTNIQDAIESHFHGENRSTPFLSVSAHADVAIAVGRHFGRKSDGRKFYLLKLKVPVIDLISYRENLVGMPSKLKQIMDYNPDYSISVSVEGKESSYKWDKEVESYIFWKIDPEDIEEITQVDVKESVWNNRKTF